MTKLFTKIQPISDSTDLDGVRDELDKISINFSVVDEQIRNFAFLLAITEENIAEFTLGVLVRGLTKYDQNKINDEVLWLFLASVLSRLSVSSKSSLRVSLLGIASRIKDWASPIFALLVIALDSFLRNSLESGGILIAEQTLDFLATWGENYAKAPRTLEQVAKMNSLARLVLKEVDEPILQEEWSEGLDLFFNHARKTKYSDQRIWSSSSELLKSIYPIKTRNDSENSENNCQVYNHLLRLITSSLAAVGTVFNAQGLSVAVHIDNTVESNFWSIIASAIDRIERLFQEFADVTFDRQVRLPRFTPAQAIPGSWTVILYIKLSSNQSYSLAKEIASLSSVELEKSNIYQDIFDSWQECVEILKEDSLRVDFAVSSKDIDLSFLPSISTDDFSNLSTEKIADFNESKKTTIRILSCDVPQANNIERILELARLFVQYPSSFQTVRDKFLEISGTTPRDFSYHRRASEILKLIDWRVHPTKACTILVRLPKAEAKMRLLAYQFISSNVGSAWLLWQNANDLSEINPESAEEFLTETCPSLSQETIKRRSQTLKAWLTAFLKYWDS